MKPILIALLAGSMTLSAGAVLAQGLLTKVSCRVTRELWKFREGRQALSHMHAHRRLRMNWPSLAARAQARSSEGSDPQACAMSLLCRRVWTRAARGPGSTTRQPRLILKREAMSSLHCRLGSPAVYTKGAAELIVTLEAYGKRFEPMR